MKSTVNDLDNRSRGECLLEWVESIMTEWIELLENVLPGKAYQWNDNIWVVEDKPVIEICIT